MARPMLWKNRARSSAAPAGVTPASLRALGKRAEGIGQVILDLEVITNRKNGLG